MFSKFLQNKGLFSIVHNFFYVLSRIAKDKVGFNEGKLFHFTELLEYLVQIIGRVLSLDKNNGMKLLGYNRRAKDLNKAVDFFRGELQNFLKVAFVFFRHYLPDQKRNRVLNRIANSLCQIARHAMFTRFQRSFYSLN
jgi:hypothetical protein